MKKKSSNDIFEQFFENSLELLCIADTEGRFKKLNPEWERSLGYTLDDLEGKYYIEFVHPDDVENTIKASTDLAQNRKVYDFINRYRHKDGTYRWIEWRSFPSQGLVFASARDITDKKLAEETIRQKEAQYHFLFDNMTSGFALHQMIYDQEGKPIDYRYIEANPAFEKLTGLSAKSIIGKTIKELLPEIEDHWIQTFGKVALTGEPMYYLNFAKDLGKYYDTYVFSPEKHKHAVVFNDVTDRINAQNALKESEGRLRGFIEGSSEGITIINEKGMIEEWNPSVEIITGLSKEEVKGHYWWDVVMMTYPVEQRNDETKSKLEKSLKELLSTGSVQFMPNIDFKIQHANGESRDVRQTLFLIKSEKGYSIASFIKDVTDKVKAEEALIKEKSFSEALLASTPGLVYLYNEEGRLVSWNKRHEIDTGYSAQELSNMHLYDWYKGSESDILAIQTGMEKLSSEGFATAEAYLQKKNGEKTLYYFTAVPTIIEGKKYFTGIAIDITERKMAEEAIKKRVIALTRPLNDLKNIDFTDLFSIDDLQKIQDTFADATGVASLITFPDGKPITKPSNFCSLCKIIRSTEKGRANCLKSDIYLGNLNTKGPTIMPCLSGGLWDAGASIAIEGVHLANWYIGQVRNDALNMNEILNYAKEIEADPLLFEKALEEVPFMKKEQFEKVSQSLYVLANEISLKAFQNIQQARFISDQNKAENTLIEVKERLQTFMDSATDAFVIWDENLNLIDINEAAMNFLPKDLEKQAILGNHINFFAKFIKEQDEFNRYQEVMKTGIPYVCTISFQTSCPGERWFTTKIFKVGAGLGIVSSDITERKLAEQEILELNFGLEKMVEKRTEELNKANKELESFVYSISHDLRAPLRHIDGFIRLMYSKIKNPVDSIQEYFEKVNYAVKRMSTMIDELLTFSRMGRKDLTVVPVNLNTIVNEVVELLKPDYIHRNIQWKIFPLPTIPGDQALLKFAFENLISNAIKYTSKNKESIIEIGNTDESGDHVNIYIKDNGVGFDMAYANKLFGVFQRLHTNEEFEGTGIGLANVKQIIGKHKGYIRAESKINEGATFYVSLPK